MFEKLQSRWKVSGWRLFFILVTFALGGSLCGYAARKLIGFIGIEKGPWWIILYIIAVIFIWPAAVIFVSMPFGQYAFFSRYLKKIFKRMSGTKKKQENQPLTQTDINIAIFASGAGSNAEKIIETLPHLLLKQGMTAVVARVALIVTDNPNAGVIKIAAPNDLPAEIIDLKKKSGEQVSAMYLSVLEKYNIDFIVLAGYLKKIPPEVIRAYPRKIVNIHPALLPAYGGAGMYGKRVHEAVIGAKEKESGISIHYVDEVYDTGQIIFQAKCKTEPNETAETLSEKIHALEHLHYTKVIAALLQSQNPR